MLFRSGFRAGVEGRQRSRAVAEEGLMLTGDENIIDIQYTVFWKIGDPALFLFNIVSPEATVKAAGESAMREVVGQMPANLALAEGRTKIETDTQKLMQKILDDYGAGVLVTQVQLRGVEPPQQVIDAFRDVQRAKAICSKCASRDECLSGALEREEPWGVWGGEQLEMGRIIAGRKPRGRPPVKARQMTQIDEVPVPAHLVA